jgi:hypothetical protein
MPTFATTKCAAKLTAASTGIIDKNQLKALFDEVDARRADQSTAEVAAKAAKTFTDQKAYEAFNAKRTALWNAKKKVELKNRAQSLMSASRQSGTAHESLFKLMGKDAKHLSPSKALEAIPTGATESGIGTGDNANAYRTTLQATEKAWLRDSLKREKIGKYATSGVYDRAIDEAQERLNTTDPVAAKNLPMSEFKKLNPEDQKGVSRVAELYNESLDRMRERIAAEGGHVPKREGYMGEQTHTREKIRSASTPGKFRLAASATTKDEDAYVGDLTKWIDARGTARNLVRTGRLSESESIDPEKFSKSLWEIFTGSIRKDPHGDGLTGQSGNIAAEAEKARILEFKDAASFSAYREKYGAGSKWESMNQQIDHMQHTATTLHFFGPSAAKNLTDVRDSMLLDLREQRAQAKEAGKNQLADRLKSQEDELNNSSAEKYMDAYLGKSNDPCNITADKITGMALALNRIAMLGGAVFSNLTSVYTHFLSSRHVGVGLLQSSMGPLFTAGQRLSGAEFNSWVRRSGVQMSAQLGQTALDLTNGHFEPGRMIKNAENVFFNMTGLTPMMNGIRASYVAGVANELAHNAGVAFDQLPGNIRRNLADYNIGSKEWDVLRAHAVTKFDGWDVMASDLVRNAPDEAFHAMTGSTSALSVKAARLDLEAKLANLYRDGADYASVTHNLKTGLILDNLVGHGNIARLTTQFATFPLAHGQLVLQRALKSQSFPAFLFKTLGGLTMTGMLAYTLRNLAKGQNPMADPDLWDNSRGKSTEAWARMLTAGAGSAGVGGIASDLLFSQTYQNGRGSSLQTMLGPTGSNVTQAIKFAYDGIEKGKINGAQALKWAQGNTPFVNAWWIRPMINYGLAYGLEEQLNPGSIHRMNKAATENGNPFWLDPEQNSNPSPFR